MEKAQIVEWKGRKQREDVVALSKNVFLHCQFLVSSRKLKETINS